MEIPTTAVQMFLQYLIAYFMLDLQGNYIAFVGAGFGLAMVSNSLAMILGSALTDVKDVSEFSSLLFVPQILFGGSFIRLNQIPVFLRWAQYLCGLSYGTKLVYFVEFNGSIKSCNTSEDARTNCYNLVHSNGQEPKQWWIDVLCLLGLFLIGRVLSGLILQAKAKSFY